LDQTVKVLGVATINEALIKGSEIDSIVIMLIVKVQGYAFRGRDVAHGTACLTAHR
jgi:hypothetical protein